MWKKIATLSLVGLLVAISFVIVEDSIGEYNPIAHIDKDGDIDNEDLFPVRRFFGVLEKDESWNRLYDINGPTGQPDGKVDMRDIALVAKHYMKQADT